MKEENNGHSEKKQSQSLGNTISSMLQEAINIIILEQEQEIAEIITNYDFIVGSVECKHKIKQLLPEANVICSHFINEPSIIYAVKKFDCSAIDFERKE